MADVIAFDIDGVLTRTLTAEETQYEDLAGEYIHRTPNGRARDLVFRAYRSGAYVLLFTGRREQQRRITEDWLHANGFHYHRLEMGKPYFTYLIDDRMLGATVDDQFEALDDWLDAKEGGELKQDPTYKTPRFARLSNEDTGRAAGES